MNNTNSHQFNRTSRCLKLIVALMIISKCAWSGATFASFDTQISEQIISKYAGRPFENLKTFALEIYYNDEKKFTRQEHETIGGFALGERLDAEQSRIIYRLIGIYTQLKYGGDALRSLEKLVSIPTFHADGVEQHENKQFIRLANELESMAQDFGLNFRNVDNRVYEISIDGVGDTAIALHAHADVVPVNPEQWVLEDGTKLDPFKVTRIGNRLYGRGTQDDKNGILVAMYAMRVMQEENITLFNDIKLLVDTTEETTSDAMPYYLERNPTPSYNLALDGGYPVVIAEKGFGILKANFPIVAASEGTAYVQNVIGGAAYNQIPAVATAIIVAPQASELMTQISNLSNGFIAANGGNFDIKTELVDGDIELRVIGESAHSSAPGSGVNPVSRMLGFINQIVEPIALAPNHITAAAKYADDNWGLDFSGKNLGIDYRHEFMGPLTAAITKLTLSDSNFEVGVNLRAPAGRSASEVKSQVLDSLETWKKESGNDATQFEMSLKEPMLRDPSGKWVNALLDISTENLGLPREFGSSSGTTSIHDLPNGVQFGLAVPGEKYTGHNANEFKTLDQFLLDLRIVAETIAHLGQMPELE